MSESTSQGQQPAAGAEGGGSSPANPAPGIEKPASGGAAPAVEAGAAAPAPGGEGQGQSLPEVPKWAQARLDQITAERRETERQLEAERTARAQLEARLAAIASPTDPAAVDPARVQTQPDPQQIEAAVAQRAAQIDFNRRCTEVTARGVAANPDFQTKIQEFGKLGGLTVPFLEAVLTTDAPEAILYELAGDLNETHRLLQMNPIQQAAELTKRAIGRKAAAQPTLKAASQAPDPISPKVGGRGSAAGEPRLDDESLPMKDWIAARQAQLKASGKRI